MGGGTRELFAAARIDIHPQLVRVLKLHIHPGVAMSLGTDPTSPHRAVTGVFLDLSQPLGNQLTYNSQYKSFHIWELNDFYFGIYRAMHLI